MKEIFIKTLSEELKNEVKLLNLKLFEEIKNIPTIVIRDKSDERKAIAKAIGGQLLIEFVGEKIIPLENLIAQLRGKTKIFVKVRNSQEARIAMETLELGADGVVLETDDISEIKKTMTVLPAGKKIKLETAKITRVTELGLGARACIDTCTIMLPGEGMLIGCSSQGMILIQAEVEKNQFVAPRPFRVNAGAVSLYTLTSEGKTRYLEEIKAGDQILMVDREGRTQNAIVGRSKIELRPLLLIEAENNGKIAKIVLQNAETVKVVTPEGSKSVTELKQGDKILAYFESGGRHFGMLIKEETVIEK